jgi:putative glutamine amidotransferase
LSRKPRIGLSACLFHADPARQVFNGRPLYYLERSMARWVGSQGALAYLVPDAAEANGSTVADIAADLDGLVLQGGVDVSPRSYGEESIRPEWSGDAARDAYEIALVRAMIDADKPVLGICRGHQLLNVAFGGTLYQDILHQVSGARVHRDAAVYEKLAHRIVIEPGSWLDALYPGVGPVTVNSVHHQAIKEPGRGVRIAARSEEDGVIEAMTIDGPRWVRGVQWHPEFAAPNDPNQLDNAPILGEFLTAATASRK